MARWYGAAAATAAAAVMVALAACGAPPGDDPGGATTPAPSSVETSTGADPSATGPSASGSGSTGSPTSAPPTSPSGPASSDSSASSTSGPGASGSTGPSPTGPADVDLARYQPEISWQQALATAREKFDGRPTSVELGWERGGLVYTVELISDSQEYEVEIDADDGQVLAESTDGLDDDEAKSAGGKVIDTPGIVAVTDAMAAATEATPGRVEEWKLARNSGGVYYEFDIVSGTGDDTEVHVDATSGKVLS